jgi:tRNA threonylcarbamoyladenosine biosynthesis protein TsaE
MRSQCLQIHLAELKETQLFAKRVAQLLLPKLHQLNQLKKTQAQYSKNGVKIYLSGNLGAGKTTFVRALLTAIGIVGTIKSPTYSLVETYLIGQLQVAHIDAYRLFDGDDFYSSGLDELLDFDLLLIEWYEKVESALPKADWLVLIDLDENRRTLTIQAQSDIGKELLLEMCL